MLSSLADRERAFLALDVSCGTKVQSFLSSFLAANIAACHVNTCQKPKTCADDRQQMPLARILIIEARGRDWGTVLGTNIGVSSKVSLDLLAFLYLRVSLTHRTTVAKIVKHL